MAKKTVKAAETAKTVEKKVAETAKAAEKKVTETAKAAEVKAKEVVAETAKVAEETAKKATEKAEEVKTTAKKTIAKAAAKVEKAVEPRMVVQYQNREVDTAAVVERVKAAFLSEGHKASDIKELSIYVKPEEYSAYYVINENFSGRVDLF